MSVRNVTDRSVASQPTVKSTTSPSSAPAPRASTPAGEARRTEASAFTTGSERARSVALGARPSFVRGEFHPQTVAPGPLDLGSAEAKEAVSKSYDFLGRQSGVTGVSPEMELTPRSVERDELGMTHVRMDRVHEGMKVLGEQMITHLDSSGKVVDTTGDMSFIPRGLGKEEPKVSREQALAMARKEFGGKTDRDPTVEKVIVRDEDGSYKTAWRVEMTNLQDGPRPQRMNYLVDAQNGQMMDRWNQIGGIELPQTQKAAAAGGKAQADEVVNVTKTAEPNAKIEDNSTVESTIGVGEDFKLDQLKLDLDLAHTYRGDLKVSLTSPSGKTVVLHDRAGGSADDLKGPFDLSSAFAGEEGKGQWKLTVEDKARLDTGTLRSWGLSMNGKKGNPPPPPPPPGGADDTTLYSGKVEINATPNANGTYSLNDTSRGNGVETRDANGQQRPSRTTEITDDNNVWGEASDPAKNQAAVDAHYGAQMTSDFYRDVLGRNSIDGRGEKLVSNVHIGKNYVNAFWDGSQMNYGDGNGKDAGSLTTLDIAGHEISHGLTERTAGLIYRGESGGINEAMSDIMGTGVEWYASQRNSAVQFDWKLGEDCWTPGTDGDALRYMDDPTKDGYSIDHYSKYPQQTEVHGSSGIMNNAFYLMANGGTNRTSGQAVEGGIGMEKGLKIYGRALTTYMTPNTNFAQAREACIKAATDLYGADSAEVQKVKQSWSAVGVG